MTDDNIIKTRFRVGGMDCAACGTKIENAVSRLPGVADVGVSVSSGMLTVSYGADTPPGAVERQVKTLGYTIAPADAAPTSGVHTKDGDGDPSHFDLGGGPWWRSRKALLTLGCGLALAAAYVVGRLFPAIEHWAFLAAMAVGLVPIARRAIVAGFSGTPFSIETLNLFELECTRQDSNL